jgi:hypothetical protein
MLLVEHKFNTSCQSITMWFLGFEKKGKKRFALELGINKQLPEHVMWHFQEVNKLAFILIKQCCNLFMSYYYLISLHPLLDPKASKMTLDHCWFNALKSTYSYFFCGANL